MRLLLIRHAQTPANAAGVIDTAIPGPGLTPLGRRQAEAIPDALRGEDIEAIYVSRLVRTQLTAEPLARALHLRPRVRDGLHEIEAGDIEGRSDVEGRRAYLEVLYAWGLGDLDRRVPGGPSGREFAARFDAAIDGIARESRGTVAVVSHGAAIRVWVGGRARNVSPGFAASHELENTGVVVMTGDPEGGWFAESWQGSPLGGEALADETAPDPTGEPITDAASPDPR